ncbi:probable Werner syndrome ATP-dependent helicase homolog 1 [Lytechinus variegatus]|uniref:probable Werner syndrome ATP-dependent helicase homolog 1 n=1 Tax=Lytechinus variegatus TaxID=7654 RepID=UPI001BB2648B|nr:probable Werner syndrome ATP-dependent helicase homolog 1 [Lytechinus variegatus]
MSVDSSRCFSDDEIAEALKYGATKLGLHDGFRSQQADALRAFFRGHDLFVSLPTGFGKSVLFQAAPFCSDYLRKNADGPGVSDPLKAIALIVMPLKSLISDQIHKVESFGSFGVDISGGMTDVIREGISSAKYSHIFASPESLLDEDGREMFTLLKNRHWICGFFIDESHCVSKWGSSSGDTKAFRSAYSKLGEIRSKLRSGVPAVALTATATREVRHAIIDSLGLRNFLWVNESPDKANIKHIVMKSSSKDYDNIFRHVIDGVRDKGLFCERTIIYCQSRKTCSEVYATFIALLPKDRHAYINMYHTNTENDVQEKIIQSMASPDGEVRVLIATVVGEG